jgi:hypothetical protein
MTDRGSSLLEVVAATAVAAIVMTNAASTSASALRGFARQRALTATIDVARARLESELGAPCTDAVGCPATHRCEIDRELLGSPSTLLAGTLVRLRSRVTSAPSVGDAGASAASTTLTTLVRRSGPCS